MKAVIQPRYGAPEVLKISDVPIPQIKEHEMLIKVAYANVSSGDARVRALDAPAMLKPMMRLIFGIRGLRHQIPGVGGSGVVVETGQAITRFKKGDRVHFIHAMRMGSYAEYVKYKETDCIAKTPDNVSLEQAAPLSFGALTAYHFINESHVKTGDHVLIYGASGSVGTYAVQLAKYYGAHVTAVASLKNQSLLRSIGADDFIDYQTTDFRTTSSPYDVIFDAVGKITKKSCQAVLKKQGIYVSVKSMTSEKQKLLEDINQILRTDQLTSVIETIYPLEDVVKAHAHVDSHRKVGNIVLKIHD